MNRRRAALRGALGAVPAPSAYRARLPPLPPPPPTAPPRLADASDVLAVHTSLHVAGRAAVVRASERCGWFLVAAPKASAAPGPGGPAVPRAAPVSGAGDIVDIGEAEFVEAGGGGASTLPPAWEVVAPVSTATPALTPAALADRAALAPGGDRPFVVLALVDRDGTVGFSRLYAGIRPPDGAPARAEGDEEDGGGGGGGGGDGSDEGSGGDDGRASGGRGRGRGGGRRGRGGGRGRGRGRGR